MASLAFVASGNGPLNFGETFVVEFLPCSPCCTPRTSRVINCCKYVHFSLHNFLCIIFVPSYGPTFFPCINRNGGPRKFSGYEEFLISVLMFCSVVEIAFLNSPLIVHPCFVCPGEDVCFCFKISVVDLCLELFCNPSNNKKKKGSTHFEFFQLFIVNTCDFCRSTIGGSELKSGARDLIMWRATLKLQSSKGRSRGSTQH